MLQHALRQIHAKKIDLDNDLVIFDEIQECPEAVTSLKYFYEEMQNLTLCCAGSLIGVMSSGSCPVGQVKFLTRFKPVFSLNVLQLIQEG